MADLVVVSLERWDRVWRRNQHLVAGLLRSDPSLRVLFVEPPADPTHALRRGARPRLGAGLREITGVSGVAPGQLWSFQDTKWAPRRVDPWADQRLARHVRRAAARLGMRRPVLWVNDPSGARLAQESGWPSLYDVTDDWVLADRESREHDRTVRNEELLLSTCDVTVVCSPALQVAKTRTGRPSPVLVPNAVDPEPYRQQHPRPSDLPDGPVVLYVGTAHPDRLDVELTADLADELGDQATVVLVGPAVLPPSAEARLRDAGVRLLGSRDSEDVPAYLQHADVLLVPHVLSPFTESLDPIKAYEYRAARRPVVATAVPGFRDTGDRGVVTAATTPDFVAAVRSALAGPRDVAGPEPPTWADRTAVMRQIVDDLAGREAKAPAVVFVTHSGQPGGAELALVRYLRLTRLPAALVALEDSPLWRTQPHPVRVLRSGVRGLPSLRRQLRQHADSLVVANTMRAALLTALSAPRRSRVVYWVRDGLVDSAMTRHALALTRRITVPRMHAFLANSDWTASTVREMSPGARVAVAASPCGVRDEALLARSARRAPRSPLRLLYLGRIAEWKAPHIALAGMQALRAAGVDCTLTVAGEALFGESGYRDRLAREAASVGGVKLLGHVEDVARVLDEHDLLLHCSLRPEPFGQVICQAMAHGVPVVATDQGGPRELLAQGGGLLYEPGKVEALVEAVGRVLASYEELSLGALNAARSHTDELIAEHLDRILSQWLS